MPLKPIVPPRSPRINALQSHKAGLCAWAVAAMLVASCGGGTSPEAHKSSMAGAEEGRKQALATLAPEPIPANAASQGMWGPVFNWPLLPIHAVLMPDGRVMTYGSRADGSSTAFFSADIWDNTGSPDTGHLTVSNGTGNDFFCSSQLLLPPALGSAGAVFIAGGDAWNGRTNTFVGIRGSTVLDAGTNTLVRGNEMERARWYSSSTTLVNGETYIQGGDGGARNPEVRQLDGSFRTLTNVDTSFLLWSYPRNYVMPDGRVFGYDFEGRMYFVDAAGTGSMSVQSILPLQYFGAGSSAMYRPGHILQIGGNTNAVGTIDVNSGFPVFTPTQSTSTVRKLANATLLPDGQVVLTGGSPVWNELQGANKAAEIWNPTTGQWTLHAAGARPRLYHSSALLLPDATVLVGGGGAPAPEGADPAGERNVEIFYPPYLFSANGTRAPRPVITSTPDWLEIGKTFAVQTTGNSAVSRVTLVKTGSVTHGWNLDQRFLELSFTASTGANGSTLSVNAPSRAGEATPGYYMLFVFDAAGVPSEARILRMGIAGPENTAQRPRVNNQSNLSSTLNQAQSLQITASDPNGDALVYSAAGLPTGLGINRSTGLITGTPSVAGRHHVVVSASDGVNSASTRFVWTVSPLTPLTLTLNPTPGASLVGSNAFFAASATGANVEYAWNFGDGSPTTAWSSQGNTNKNYANPGSYVVTLSVRDSTGSTLSRSFLQTVYIGSGTRPAQASANLVIETPVLGPDRLWVVNQDNDSISGFDTQTNQRLAEVAVGSGPRSVAVDSAGLLWVTNKFSATVSIVDPAQRAVVRTLTLPRASQPFGVVTAPGGTQAYVVLEATGQLLRFNTQTFEQTGSLALGPNVRHVSVTGNGSTLYVSRFITPPLPGEATANVDTGASRGAEVVQVDAATLTATRTIVLSHSNRSDAENQGSGIPNYLGAAAISPDGSQAYVPGKQDNILRGQLRNGRPLDFQNSVRAISSRIALTGSAAGNEDLARRVDHDNAGLATAAAYDRRGVLLFVALETSREVAVVDAHSGAQLTRFDVGRAPQGLAVSNDGYTLYVNNFMDRTVSVHDLRPLLTQGLALVQPLATLSTLDVDKLGPTVLLGKQLFYDARDPRLARDRYLSCASCHSDGGHDGRTWDLTQMGEGVRNTVALRGRAGGQGRLHWSANFDEVQDFEAQIRALAGGSGLMTDEQLNTGTRAQPLGDRKAGVSADLDALAAYLVSLDSFAPSPLRNADGSLTAEAALGKPVFEAQCQSCHGTAAFTLSASLEPQNVGTLKAASGRRLGGMLTGIDTPTLRDAWATAPYLHDGSAATLAAAVSAHNNLSLNATQLAQVAAYVAQIGSEEAGGTATPPTPPTAQGLVGNYYNNTGLLGSPVLTRTEAVNFGWGQASPGAPVGTDNFSVRWTGKVVAPVAGAYTFQTESDDGVRLWVNGQQVINNWTDHGPALDNSPAINLAAGQQVDVVLEYYERGSGATIRFNWRTPGASSFVPIPVAQLVPGAVPTPNTPPVISTPAAQVGLVGVATTLQMVASDANGDTLSFSASGLPAGMTIAPGTGLISGTPSAAGSTTALVTVADGKGGSASVSFGWTVQAPAPVSTGLLGRYFNNTTLGGTPVLTREEAVNFNWGTASPGAGLGGDNFSVRWTGRLIAPAAGSYQFQTESDDGVRLWVNGQLLVNNWSDHSATLDTSAAVTLAAGQQVDVVMEYFERGGDAVARLNWRTPGATGFVAVPQAQLRPLALAAPANVAPVIGTPANQTGTVGAARSLQLSASDANGDTLNFSASGLPAGLSIAPGTGLISGTPTTAGNYNTVVTVSDGKGGTASASFGWNIQPTPLVLGGLLGSYYNNSTLSGTPSLTRVEAVNFNWGSGRPNAAIGTDRFSVRWTGKLLPPQSGSYTFQTESDDGVRLWVNGQLLIDNWTIHASTTDTSRTITLNAGQAVDIRLEYYEATGEATMRLRWRVPSSGSFVAIPSNQLGR